MLFHTVTLAQGRINTSCHAGTGKNQHLGPTVRVGIRRMRRENGMLTRLIKHTVDGMGGGLKRYALYHKTQGVPDEWAFDDRKKQIFGLSSGVHKALSNSRSRDNRAKCRNGP